MITFEKFTPDLHALFYGLAPEDKPHYAKGVGKIDGISVFLEFVATASFLTVLVSYGSSRQDMAPFELTREVNSLENAKRYAESFIDWSDVNLMYLEHEMGFDVINTGHFRTEDINRQPLDDILVEVIWLDLDDEKVVDIAETLNLAMSAPQLVADGLFYDFKYNERQCLVLANRPGLTNIQLRKLVERWMRSGGVS